MSLQIDYIKFSVEEKVGNGIRSITLLGSDFSELLSTLSLFVPVPQKSCPSSGSWGTSEDFLALCYLQTHRLIMMTARNLFGDE